MHSLTIPLTIVIGLALFFIPTRKTWATPPLGLPFESEFKLTEQTYNLPRGILSRIAKQESNYNPAAKGTSGEIGIMQITPRWHPNVNAANPYDSINYAGALLRKYYNEFGNWQSALAAYNWGETNVRNKGIEQAPESTRRYIKDVLSDIGL